MVHVGIALQGEQFRYPHRADATAAAEVVAQQVDDHQVFRAILAAGQQLGGQFLVLGDVAAARPGALDRPGLDLPLVHAEKALRRQAEDRAVVQGEIAGEGSRAGVAQGAVGRPRVALPGRLEALGKVHLVAVAGANVGLDAFDGGPILAGVEVGGKGRQQTELAGRGGRAVRLEQGD
ncbi:hypothetical protein D3C84_673820 [compost metagenome]